VKFIPAIDIKDKKCVRLEKGKEESARVFNNNPLEQAKFFEKNGCERIHIVDLDSAFGRPNINKDLILKIRNDTNLLIELGGGIKNENDILFWINKGIDYLILGSLAIQNKKLVLDVANKNKNKIYVALDALDKKIMIKGWVENSEESVDDIISFYNSSFIKGFIFTDISRDGMLRGIDLDLINNFISKTDKDIIVGGGLSTYEDIINLKKINSPNLEGVIAGKSFYSGNIKINKALEILNNA